MKVRGGVKDDETGGEKDEKRETEETIQNKSKKVNWVNESDREREEEGATEKDREEKIKGESYRQKRRWEEN